MWVVQKVGIVLLTILAATRMVMWMMHRKVLYAVEAFPHHNMMLFFKHQVKVEIRHDSKSMLMLKTVQASLHLYFSK